MKQALQLRLGQHLTMTPQLQQAIRLLQLSTLELRTEIQDALESNLMLEVAEDGDTEPNEQPERPQSDDSAQTDRDLDLQRAEMPDDLPVDTVWEDVYDSVPTTTYSAPGDGDGADFESYTSSGESLHQHLRWQMQLAHFSDVDLTIAETIIDSINDDGYLSVSLEDIQAGFAASDDIELDEIEAVLRRIQNFDPPGVGARDLPESLRIQLRQLPEATPWRTEAAVLIDKHFELLANRDYSGIMRRMKLQESDLKDVIRLIQSLNPRPGGQITDSEPEYIVPDVIVRKVNDTWKVELNPDAAPRLRINPHYAGLIKRSTNEADSSCMKTHLQEARWFLKSLQSRNETLLRVATSIVKHQRDFLEHGEEAMRALVLHDIAEEVNMHESTISRVTSKKYMHTPRGIYELKYFFSSHVSTASGGECSATAIRAFIKKLIAAENSTKPLSDSKIASILSAQGINVARRTVAKYREAMAIPPSNERKSLT